MTQIRLGKRAALVKSCRGQNRDFNGGMLVSWGLQMFLGGCRCPMGDAYVLEGCGCPREGCRYTRDWMLMSWGEDADVPGRGCSCPWGDADVPGRGMQGLERGCTCPGVLRSCRQGGGSRGSVRCRTVCALSLIPL